MVCEISDQVRYVIRKLIKPGQSLLLYSQLLVDISQYICEVLVTDFQAHSWDRSTISLGISAAVLSSDPSG